MPATIRYKRYIYDAHKDKRLIMYSMYIYLYYIHIIDYNILQTVIIQCIHF